MSLHDDIITRLRSHVDPSWGSAGEVMRDAADELERLRAGHERYETVRRMNAQQFKDAFTLSLRTGKPFDEIVDDLRPFVRPDPQETPR